MDETIDIAAANARGETPSFVTCPKADHVEIEEHDDDTATWRFSYEGRVTHETKDDAEAKRLLGIIQNVATPAQRRAMKKTMAKQLATYKAKSAARRADLEERKARIEASIRVREWLHEPVVLQRQDGSALHRMTLAADTGRHFIPKHSTLAGDGVKEAIGRDYDHAMPPPFIVTHNWAKAIGPAISEGQHDYKIPYSPLSLFEFRITNRQVMAFVHDDGSVDAYAEDGLFWIHVVFEGFGEEEVLGRQLIETLRTQIRAVCIAIDADVAVAETVRVDERLNRSRIAKGRMPMSNHHVVHLAKRTERPAPLPDDHTGEKRRTPRLHFVRGHWKHYANHKTWVKWFLRGDPDLGFIEKEYRL